MTRRDLIDLGFALLVFAAGTAARLLIGKTGADAWAPAAIIAVILGGGFWLGHRWASRHDSSGRD